MVLGCLFCCQNGLRLVFMYLFLNKQKDNTYLKCIFELNFILQNLKAYVIKKRILALIRSVSDCLNHTSQLLYTNTAATAKDLQCFHIQAGWYLTAKGIHQSLHKMTHTIHILAAIHLLLTIAFLWKTLSINVFPFLF